jgi:[ribosomal protein S5]-alanine N-acetyltransferase
MSDEKLILRRSSPADLDEVRDAYAHSISIHTPWAFAPVDYTAHLAQTGRYFVCLERTGRIVGTFHISGIIRGLFQSAYLGYEVFAPHQGCGYMTQGLRLLLAEAFNGLRLHRLEANIQSGNLVSIHLVEKAGFIKEGFSRQYLRVDGREWKDHERWAILNPNWAE